jgi:rhodanese-related sulfurtransferase
MLSSQELCAQARSQVKEVTIEQLKQQITAGARVIDVREPAEFAVGHIRQAVNMPRGVLEMQIHQHPAVAGYEDSLQRMAAEPVYLICRTGGRSALSAESLIRMGFDKDKVISVAGGMQAWETAKYPQVAGE